MPFRSSPCSVSVPFVSSVAVFPILERPLVPIIQAEMQALRPEACRVVGQ